MMSATLDLKLAHAAAKRLHDEKRNPNDPTWDELPLRNQASQTTTVARNVEAYLTEQHERKIREKRSIHRR